MLPVTVVGRVSSGLPLLIALMLLVMPQLRYASLHAGFFDLGQYALLYSNVVHDGLLEAVANTHLHPFMLAFAPIYWLVPSPATLLALQSGLLIAGMALYARLWVVVGAGGAWTGALLYAVSLSVWVSALGDYHFEHLLFPLVAAYALALQRPNPVHPVVLVALALAICAIKELFALTALMIGIVTALHPGRRRAGIAITVVSLAYFLAATGVVIPAFSDGRPIGELWKGAFGYLGRTPVEMVFTLLTQPWTAIQSGNFGRKMIFVGAVLLPFACALPRGWWWGLPALPPLAIVLLSQSESHAYLGHQYAAPITAVLLVAAAVGLSRMCERRRSRCTMVALLASTLVLVLFGPSPVSRLFYSPGAWAVRAQAYWATQRDAAIRELIELHVPADRAVVVSMQATLTAARLVERTHALPFPRGVDTPAPTFARGSIATHGADSRRSLDGEHYADLARRGLVYADIVVLDRKRPWTLVDQTCAWQPARACRDREFGGRFHAAADLVARRFERIAEHDGFEIWRRRPVR